MNLSLLVVVTLIGGLLAGFIPTLIDSLKKSWQARLSLPEPRLDWASRLFYLTWLPAMPLAGLALDHLPSRDVLFFGLAGLILGLSWLAMVRTWVALLGSIAVVGCAYSIVTTCSIRFMATVFFPEEEGTDSCRFASLNVGFIAVGLGAMIGPIVARQVERWWGYRQGLLYVGLACIVPAAITLGDRDQFPPIPEGTIALTDTKIVPMLGLFVGIILLYFVLENCLDIWPESYLKELGYETKGARWAMIIFWLIFIGSRALAAWWLYLHPHHAIPLTFILMIASALVMGNLAGGYEVGSGSIGFWLAAACYGPLLPCLLGLVLSPNLPVFMLGLLLSLSGLDTLVFRPMLQTFGAARPARTLMRIPAILAFVIVAPLLILILGRY